MPFKPYKIDDSFLQTEPGRARVPMGYYKAVVAGLRPTSKDYDGVVGYHVDFRITDAPSYADNAGIGRTFPRYCSMGSEGHQFNLPKILGAVGAGALAQALHDDAKFSSVDTWEKHAQLGQFIEGKIKGRAVILAIHDRTFQGRTFSDILEVSPPDNWETIRHSKLIGGSSVSTPAPEAPNGNATLADQVQGMFEAQDVA